MQTDIHPLRQTDFKTRALDLKSLKSQNVSKSLKLKFDSEEKLEKR